MIIRLGALCLAPFQLIAKVELDRKISTRLSTHSVLISKWKTNDYLPLLSFGKAAQHMYRNNDFV